MAKKRTQQTVTPISQESLQQNADATAEIAAAQSEQEPAMVDTGDGLEVTEVSSIPALNSGIPTNGGHQEIVIEIDPDNVLIDPNLRALRAWNGHSRQELALPELARTIYEEGQKEPARAYESDEGYVLYDGHRRREAVQIIREEWDGTFQLKLLVDNDLTPARALRAAMLADSQHEKFTPMELGRNIAFLRKQFNWGDKGGTAQVADFLGVSPATVTQMERLAAAPVEVQQKVESGELTPTAALDLISVTSKIDDEEMVEKQKAVVERAAEIAQRQQEKREAEQPQKKRTPVTKEQAAIAKRVKEAAYADRAMRQELSHSDATPGSHNGHTEDVDADESPVTDVDQEPAPTPAKKARVEGKHIRQAAKQVLGDKGKIKAPKMSEAIELIEQWAGPAYPEVMMKFAGTFADWGRGKKSDKVLEAAWDDIADALAGKKPKKVVKATVLNNKPVVTKKAPPKAPPKKVTKPTTKKK